jgi:hypothetical protein
MNWPILSEFAINEAGLSFYAQVGLQPEWHPMTTELVLLADIVMLRVKLDPK